MNIKNERPPHDILGRCEAHFDLSTSKPIFTYGDTIYNPFNGEIDDLLIAHETAHAVQQGEDPESWWARYLTDTGFRFKEELAAYQVQYQVARDTVRERNKVAMLLYHMAADLSGPMYGSMCTAPEARVLIRG